MPVLSKLKDKGYDIIPIMSSNVYTINTRFGEAQYWKDEVERITGNKILYTLPDVEPIGPKNLLDMIVVAPCTGNTLAKLANGISDTSVTMACKSQWRNQKPVVLAISTNDGLGINMQNIAKLMVNKNVYFVPFGQDNPTAKPKSLVSDMTLVPDAINAALKYQQLQPVIITYR
ncbi:dipicolinate synthase subunit B [Clostridium sp. 'deep sea']|nr:dipicolinate synthase subunit B [Clostridium sp. 'deep sea']